MPVSILTESRLLKLVRKPGFWVILFVLALITILHYARAIEKPGFLIDLFTELGLTEHAHERMLYLAPIIWGSFLFMRKGGIIVSFLAVAIMLPNVFLLPLSPLVSIVEIITVFIIGLILAITIGGIRIERERRIQLETTQQQLQVSEENYRSLYENALDAIWIHDFQGNIITANSSAEKLTGYRVPELTKMNVKDFLSLESTELARQIREKLLRNEVVEQPYEQRLSKRDGSEVVVQLVTSLVFSKGRPIAFQHMARDITEQKRLQENLQFYSHRVTELLEEERERISRDIYEEVIQSLTAHFRHLEMLTSGINELTAEKRTLIEAFLEQTNNLIDELRSIASNLHPPVLDDLGLLPALQSMATDITERSGVAIEIRVHGTERRLHKETELALFRIAEEALKNAWRHSQAQSIELKMDYGTDKTIMTVSDDGKGSQLPKALSDLVRDGKLGLAAMQERALSVGSTLTVQSGAGKGTIVNVELPNNVDRTEESRGS